MKNKKLLSPFKPRKFINEKVEDLLKDTKIGESAYLVKKGLYKPDSRILNDGSLVLPILDVCGEITGAQVISRYGYKKLISGTVKIGSFIPVSNIPEEVDTIIVTEEYATALTIKLIKPDAFVLASIDSRNLKPIAEILKFYYPRSKIIIAGDNDCHPEKINIGKKRSEQAAALISGWVTLPPTNEKADWNDYCQEYGLEMTSSEFDKNLQHFTIDKLQKENRLLSDGTILQSEELDILNEINRKFTHVIFGGKHKIVSLKPCQINGMTHEFEDLDQFTNRFLHLERVANRLAGGSWLIWEGKSYKPDGIGFFPNLSKCPESVYNMYMGLSVEPVEGDCSPYLNHIKQIICGGNEESYTYLIGWLAHLIQRPDEKPSVAIVMKSVQGAGKGTMVKPLQDILGQYAVHINGVGQITGKFNATIANKLLIFADEVKVGRNYEGDRLKAIISEKTINLERKGIDPEPMPNFARLIFASNNTQAIKAGIRERRYLVLEPSSAKAKDKVYFNNLHCWLKNNGAGKLLYFLQSYDLKDFDCYRCPQTKELREEIVMGLKEVYGFLYEELSKNRPFNGLARIPTLELSQRYIAWCKDNQRYVNSSSASSAIGKVFKQMNVGKTGRRGRGLGVMYELPNVDDFRNALAECIGMNVDDLFF